MPRLLRHCHFLIFFLLLHQGRSFIESCGGTVQLFRNKFRRSVVFQNAIKWGIYYQHLRSVSESKMAPNSMSETNSERKMAKIYNLQSDSTQQRQAMIGQIFSYLPKTHAMVIYEGEQVLCTFPGLCAGQAGPLLRSLGAVETVKVGSELKQHEMKILQENCNKKAVEESKPLVLGGKKSQELFSDAVASEFYFSHLPTRTHPAVAKPTPNHGYISWAKMLASCVLAAIRSGFSSRFFSRLPLFFRSRLKDLVSNLELRLSLIKDAPPPSILGNRRNVLTKVWAGKILGENMCQSINQCMNSIISTAEGMSHGKQSVLLSEILPSEQVVQVAQEIKQAMAQHFGFNLSEICLSPQEIVVEPVSCAEQQKYKRTSALLEAIVLLNSEDRLGVDFHDLNGFLTLSKSAAGMGFLYSGKRLHQERWLENVCNDKNMYVLKVSVQVQSPCLRLDIPSWTFGTPSWHLGSKKVADEDILNRCYAFDSQIDLPLLKNLEAKKIEDDSELQYRIHQWPPWSDQVRIYGRIKARGMLSRWSGEEVGNCYTILNKRTDRIMDKTVNSLFDCSRVNARVAPMVSVFVEPEYRGGSVGILLMRRLLRYLKSKNYQFMIITVDDNGSGKLFKWYESLGFKHAKRIDDKAMITDISNPLDYKSFP